MINEQFYKLYSELPPQSPLENLSTENKLTENAERQLNTSSNIDQGKA